jgi:hypothetical protein
VEKGVNSPTCTQNGGIINIFFHDWFSYSINVIIVIPIHYL